MAFDISTYVPGDAWATPDFFTRALAAPSIQIDVVSPGESTPDSYFEYRMPNGGLRYLDASVEDLSLNGNFVVHLERSYNQGATWSTVKVFDGPGAETVPVASCAMWRLTLQENTTANPVGLVLQQSL